MEISLIRHGKSKSTENKRR